MTWSAIVSRRDHVNDWRSERIQLIEKNLLLVTETWLADWFIDRYIQKCARLCSISRCLSWPSQAADWKTRHRNYDWPDSATADRVISNGCDVVHVAHPRYRQDEWESQHQWRLSFSRAEILLLNSWMPAQQIVYHMLRYYVKTQCLTTYSADKIFSNYHVKTLMLWACELKPRSWWTGDLNVVKSCVLLLHTLAVSLTDACCQHYFINNCNLMDHVNDWRSERIQLIEKNLLLLTETWLADWFIDRYI